MIALDGEDERRGGGYQPHTYGLKIVSFIAKKEHLESTKELTLSNSPLAAERAHSQDSAQGLRRLQKIQFLQQMCT